MEKMKYVKVGIFKSIIIFPTILEHSDFKHFNPVSAGFCYISSDKVQCFGESISLGLKSNEQLDTLDATEQYCGKEAMLKLNAFRGMGNFILLLMTISIKNFAVSGVIT